MLVMMDQLFGLHNLINLTTIQESVLDVLDSVDDDFVWLDEILAECKKSFLNSEIQLLPKTPSKKKPVRKRAKIYDILEEDTDKKFPRLDEAQQCEATATTTPPRRLRTRIVPVSTSQRVPRSCTTASKHLQEKENLAPGPIISLIESITSCRQSSQANKRKSFKVLASKARPTSTHGRPSVQLLNSDDVVLGQYVNEESVPAQTDNERILFKTIFDLYIARMRKYALCLDAFEKDAKKEYHSVPANCASDHEDKVVEADELTEIQNCEATAASTSPRRLRTQPEHVSTALRLIQNCTTSSKTLQEKENLVSGPVINLTEDTKEACPSAPPNCASECKDKAMETDKVNDCKVIEPSSPSSQMKDTEEECHSPLPNCEAERDDEAMETDDDCKNIDPVGPSSQIKDAKEGCHSTSPNYASEHEDEVMEADDDSDYEDIEPSGPSSHIKVKQPVSFLTQLKKKSSSCSAHLTSGVVTSFLKHNTPQRKPTFQIIQQQRQKELLEKQKREQERLNRIDELRKNKADEQKRKREERMRKVAEMRELWKQKENDLKKNLAEKRKEKLNSADKMKEDRFREEREKQKLRLKKQLEADGRRKQEEEDRLKKLLEQQEEQRRHEEFLQRKKEYEEQERQQRQAEERRRQEEKQAESDRARQILAEKIRQQDLEREKEKLLLKEQREKTAVQERAEREKQEIEKRKERDLKIQLELEKLREMEKQRLARMAADEEEKRKVEAQLQQVILQHNRNLMNINVTSTLKLNSISKNSSSCNTTFSVAAAKPTCNPDSYPITPVRPKKKSSLENYDISDLHSDDATDDEEAPRKKIPSWASGASLKALLISQVYHPPDLDAIFGYIDPPDLNGMFERKRARFNKRTSSAVWNSPLQKPY